MCDGAKVHFGMVLKLHKIKMCSVEEFSGIFFFLFVCFFAALGIRMWANMPAGSC